MPLGELGVDVNRPVSISRRERDSGKDYARVVKKLRIGRCGDEENRVLQEKVRDGQCVSSASSFVGTRVEDDQIKGSPRKKSGHLRDAGDVVDGQSGLQVLFEDEDATEDEEDGEEDDELISPFVGDIQIAHDVDMRLGIISSDDTSKLVCGIEDAAEALESSTEGLLVQEVQHDQEHEEDEHDGAISSSATVSEQHSPSIMSNEEDGEDVSTSEPAVIEENQIEGTAMMAQPEITAAATEDKPTIESADADETLFLQNFVQKSKAEREARETGANNHFAADTAHIQTSKDKELVSNGSNPAGMKPDTGLTRESASQQDINIDSLNAAEEVEAQTSPLRRSKRAAVAASSVPRLTGLVSTIQLKRASGNEFIFRAGRSGVNAGGASSNLINDPAHIGIVTRTNTRRNKGTALNVKYRMEQLKDISGEAEEQEIVKQIIDGQPATMPNENSSKHDTATSRGRKRAAAGSDEGIRPMKKVLRWNDAELVQYSEVPAREIPSSDAEADEKDSTAAAVATKIQLKLRTATTNNVNIGDEEATKIEGPATEAQKDQLDGSAVSQTRVRRTRARPGTPGPSRSKTRSSVETRNDKIAATDERGALETADVGTEDGLQSRIPESAAVTAAVAATTSPEDESESIPTTTTTMTTKSTKPTRKSRMPVPTNRATPIGQSASISTSSTRAAAAAGAGTASKLERSIKASVKTDLLGPRRLRVRP